MRKGSEPAKGKYFDSIRMKIVVIMVLSILPLNVLVILSTGQSIRAIREQATYSMESTANLFMQQLDSRIFAINYYFYDLYEHDTDFIRLTRQQDDDAYALSRTVVAQKLRANIVTAANADGYFLYGKRREDSLLILPDSGLADDSVQFQTIHDALEVWLLQSDLSALSRWRLAEVDGSHWLMYVYDVDTFYFGAVISIDALYRNVAAAMDYPGLEATIDAKDKEVERKGYLSANSTVGRTALTLHLSVPNSEIMQRLSRFQWLGIILAFVYLLLIPVLILILNRILLKPLHRIRDALLRLKFGDQSYRISAHNDSEEFRTINQSFNEMADNIAHLKIENYENEAARQKVEFRNLQLQIRPHFLLNMFKLIHSLAQIKEYGGIQQLALYLSSYFRYIFRSAKELETFEQEYRLIREYIEISKIRYPDRFSVCYQVEESALGVAVPPLLIHNFVENIFNHALRTNAVVHIELCAKQEGGWAEFMISDDGVGMDDVVMNHINQGLFSTEDGGRIHLGINNSYQRLQYAFGERSSLQVSSERGKGTCFTIRFPCEGKEGLQNESADC